MWKSNMKAESTMEKVYLEFWTPKHIPNFSYGHYCFVCHVLSKHFSFIWFRLSFVVGAKKKIPILVSSNQKAKFYCDLLSIFVKICTVCSRPSSIISDASHWDNLHKNVPSFTIILWWMHNEGKLISRRGVHNFHKQTRGRVVQHKKFMFF